MKLRSRYDGSIFEAELITKKNAPTLIVEGLEIDQADAVLINLSILEGRETELVDLQRAGYELPRGS